MEFFKQSDFRFDWIIVTVIKFFDLIWTDCFTMFHQLFLSCCLLIQLWCSHENLCYFFWTLVFHYMLLPFTLWVIPFYLRFYSFLSHIILIDHSWLTRSLFDTHWYHRHSCTIGICLWWLSMLSSEFLCVFEVIMSFLNIR